MERAFVRVTSLRLVISVGGPSLRCPVREQDSRESVKASSCYVANYKEWKKEEGKEKRWSAFSDAVAFIVGIGAAKEQARGKRDRCWARELQRVDDQCDVRWWASRSGGQSINH